MTSAFDDFFRTHYWPMVRYCASFGFNWADVEEEVASAIERHFEEYRAKTGPTATFRTLHHWINRRVLLNLKTRCARKSVVEFMEQPPDQLNFDDPAEVVDVLRRLPQVPQLLVDWEPASKHWSRRTEGGRPLSQYTIKQQDAHKYSKRKFLRDFDRGPQ